MKKFKSFLFSFTPFLAALAVQLAVVYYFIFVSQMVFPIFGGEQDIMNLWNDINFNALVSIVFSISCVAFFGIWYYKSCGGDYRPHFKENYNHFQLAGVIMLVPATQFATSLIVSIIYIINSNIVDEYKDLMESAGMGENIPLYMMIYSVCLAPISEELIFRGVTMRIARRAFPFWFANLLQAVLFGVFHMNLLQGIYTFALGLVLGYVCEKGGHIYYAMFFHFLFNLWGTTSSYLLELIPEAILGYIIMVGVFFLFPAGLLLFTHGAHQKSLRPQHTFIEPWTGTNEES